MSHTIALPHEDDCLECHGTARAPDGSACGSSLCHDGYQSTRWLPAKRELCSRCDGNGTHTNPAIDGNGITGDEMRELGEDFQRDYMSGVYDVSCEACKGQRWVLVVDRDTCTPEQLKAWDTHMDDLAASYAESEAERRMGA